MDSKEEIAEMIIELSKDRDLCRLSDCETCEGREYGEQCLLSFYAKKALHKVNEARKETAKEILDEVAKHYGGAWLIELYKKYGVEVDE